MSDDDSIAPACDEERAAALVGETVLIGLTRTGPEGTELQQMFGTVSKAEQDGIEMTLGGTRTGEVFRLPADATAFFAAPPGEYRLRTTGEVVSNPAFTTTWDVSSKAD